MTCSVLDRMVTARIYVPTYSSRQRTMTKESKPASHGPVSSGLQPGTPMKPTTRCWLGGLAECLLMSRHYLPIMKPVG